MKVTNTLADCLDLVEEDVAQTLHYTALASDDLIPTTETV
jgi:hypothetical protein